MNFTLDKNRVIRALRLVLALAAGIVTAYLIKIPMSGWITVTTTVVLFDQETIGGAINRSKLRFLATLFGSLIALVCILFFHDNWLIIWSVLSISCFVYAYIFMGSKKSYIGVLGIATMAILIFGSNGGTSLQHAMYRIIDIVIGISFALLSMLLFFPQYAINKSHQLIFKALDDITNLIKNIQNQDNIEQVRQHILTIETKFLSDVTNFNKTIDEAKHELAAKKNPQLIENYSKCLLQIRRLYRLLIVIFYYELENDNLNDPYLNQILSKFLQIIQSTTDKNQNYSLIIDYLELNELISQIKTPTLRKTTNHFATELKQLHNILGLI
ncbi:MAG: FUSC family protein [Neisseriaceae bacterium]|nr:MAG: FUSC family protein [Neisseriaceae bacterium]